MVDELKTSAQICSQFLTNLKKFLPVAIKVSGSYPCYLVSANKHSLELFFFKEEPVLKNQNKNIPILYIGIDQVLSREIQLFSVIQSRLYLNKKIFARKCEVKRVYAPEAEIFLNKYHLMGYAKSATYIGLYYSEELLAVASFSSGRKMNRLPPDKRSHELIRFCCKAGITVSGGLSKIIRHFVEWKKPGDIMTYIDRQFGEGKAYTQLGFRFHSYTDKQLFLINKKSGQRVLYAEYYDKKAYYKTENFGNLKLVLKIET